MASVYFIPESPRFLLANGREEEALAFLVKYHGNGDPNSRLVALEIDEMKENISLDGIDKRPLDCKWPDAFGKPVLDDLEPSSNQWL